MSSAEQPQAAGEEACVSAAQAPPDPPSAQVGCRCTSKPACRCRQLPPAGAAALAANHCKGLRVQEPLDGASQSAVNAYDRMLHDKERSILECVCCFMRAWQAHAVGGGCFWVVVEKAPFAAGTLHASAPKYMRLSDNWPNCNLRCTST